MQELETQATPGTPVVFRGENGIIVTATRIDLESTERYYNVRRHTLEEYVAEACKGKKGANAEKIRETVLKLPMRPRDMDAKTVLGRPF